MRKIIKTLNFQSLCRVNKKRAIYNIKDYEISLDKIVGLGSFVEMEYKGNKTIKVKDVVEEMKRFLKEKGCGKLEVNNGGYAFMLMFPDEVKFEEL
jgi:predicted adenylyl cyclase CyaB